MNQNETLRQIVAKLAETEPSSIGSGFSLQGSALKGSIKRAALAAAIRRDLGINCPAAHAVATFGELEQAVFGKTVPSEATVAHPHSSGNGTAPALPLANLMAANGASAIRCGIDIESIADLPEATDYREHQFYQDSFSQEEIAYCVLQENPRMHFAARWCAKEALIKCDPAFRGEKLSNVEVARNEEGEVFLRHRRNGDSHVLPHSVSLSHTNAVATAVVVSGASSHVVENKETTESPNPIQADEAPAESPRIVWAMAWLLAMAVAILALVRTFR